MLEWTIRLRTAALSWTADSTSHATYLATKQV